MNNTFLFIILVLLLIGCQSPEKAKPDPGLKIQVTDSTQIIKTPEELVHEVNYSDSLNHTDINGLKQGPWERYWNDKLVESYFYVNDTLHGPYKTDHGEGVYKHGKKHGYQFSYYGDKESILMVNYFEDGEHLWGGFPRAGRDLLIPIKEFHILKDSVHVVAPYINGKTWYEGSFCLLPDSLNSGNLTPHSYGIHKVYHMNGSLKGIVDYDNKTIVEYDSSGVEL